MTVIARKENAPAAYQVTFFQRQVSVLEAQYVGSHILGIHLRTAFPPISRAPRGFTAGEGPLAAASPQTPGLGGNRLRASLDGSPKLVRRVHPCVLNGYVP
jgi:hypothetical protein